MNDPFQCYGKWWLPGKPETKAWGELRYSPADGSVLELQGTLLPMDASPGITIPIILGYTNSGKEITLQQCWLRMSGRSIPGSATSQFVARAAFVGAHFEAPERILFTGVEARYSNLATWINPAGMQIQIEQHPADETAPHPGGGFAEARAANNSSLTEQPRAVKHHRLNIGYRQPDTVRLTVNGWQLALGLAAPCTQQIGRFELREEGWLRLLGDGERLLDEFRGVLDHLRDFLCLAMAAQPHLISLKGFREEGGFPVGVFYRQPNPPQDDERSDLATALFTLVDIENDLERLLGNWLGKADSLEPVYDLYFSTRYGPPQYVRSVFLSLTQALETYHRRMYGGEYQTEAEYHAGLYQSFVAAIPKELDEGFRQSLKTGSLWYANQYSLRKRIRVLMERLSQHLSIHFIETEDRRRAFADRVAKVRNYLTHYDPKEELNVDNSQLTDLVIKLDLLLVVCLLEELGLSLDRIRDLIAQHPVYRTRSQRP